MAGTPRVSCIMPTCNRRPFVERSLIYFARQDCPNIELIIIDDGDQSVGDLIPDDSRIRYRRVAPGIKLGDKRNLACDMSNGLIIAEWDDDDWYGPQRLSQQIAPLLKGEADISGLTTRFLDLERWQGWACSPELHSQMFMRDVHGGTLVFWRWVWERLGPYPSVDIAEDAIFLDKVCRRGALLRKLPNNNTFVYMRHGKNSWRFVTGTHMNPGAWQPLAAEALIPPEDRPFYQAYRKPARQPARNSALLDSPQPAFNPDTPLVTCIMLTPNRHPFVPRAITYFQRQDYANRELLILDDSAGSVEDLIPPDPRIRYVRLNQKLTAGQHRNLACELARGTLIAHWDDTGWIAPHRLAYQVSMLAQHNADLCGANRQIYYDPSADRAWLYTYPPDRGRFWVSGNTLLYRKSVWQRTPFAEITGGEDTRFIWSAEAQMLALPDHLICVGMLHNDGPGQPHRTGPHWQPHPIEEVHRLLGEDLAISFR